MTPPMYRRAVVAILLTALAACDGSDSATVTNADPFPEASAVELPWTSSVDTNPTTGYGPESTSTAAPGSSPSRSPTPTSASISSAAADEAQATTSEVTEPPTTRVPSSTEPRAGITQYVVPSPDPGASWADTHSGYPATDIFVPSGCGGDVLSPVDGVLLEVRRVDRWDPSVDNPATRGGRSIAILGDDGVRYYLAHFADIEEALAPAVRVAAGDRLGSVGTTGRSSACHIHFGISPPCPDKEWSVRRGAIWPYPFLDAWRRGEQLSPADEIRAWIADHPDACALAALDPHAGDA